MMSNYKNIVTAVDGSEEAKLALKKAISIAKESEANLIITHIIDTRVFATIEQYDRTVVSKAEEYGKELLEQYKLEAEAAGIENVSTALDFGSPKIKITKSIAPLYHADLIVVGATGLNAAERFLIGSVSENIARRASCDVLLVRKGE
ncbi:universal stress protein [Thalassorhabdus alkalitolerans]|uniref:Universal stress protein n=1 Tax=Thalassorhabdus alkalitolerans TaxID=2282697 RepID=A0ABW0YIU7_9BACI|nr:universal stress protein [Thalassobacillus sp. C254]